MERLLLRKITKTQSRASRNGPRVVMPAPPPKKIFDERIALFLLAVFVLILFSGIVSKYANQPPQVEAAAQPTAIAEVLPTPAPTATPTAGILSKVFTPSVLYWEPLIVEAAWAQGFDPNLLAIVVQIESCGYQRATSHAGAMGLGQVMPFHFQPGEDPYDPATNLMRGALYFAAGLKSSNNDIGLTFAGYNGGHGTVQKGRGYWKAETIRYHEWATGIFWDIKNGNADSPTIQRWLGAGGNSLCQQANADLGI